MLRSLPLLLALAWLAPAEAQDAAPRSAEHDAVALKRVSEQLICQCSCNMILSECSHQSCPFALPQRKLILEAIQAGKSDDTIIAGYVDKFGRSILSAPPTTGSLLDRLAWIAPALALLFGAVVVIHFIRQFTRRARAQAIAAAPTGDPYLQRIEEELKPGSGDGA